MTLDGGRVLLAALPRAFGYCFNPISVFWCFGPDGEQRAVVVEVHNTYGDRHAYLVHPDEQGRARTDKQMYVSPFHGTDGHYELAVPVPGDDGSTSPSPSTPTTAPSSAPRCAARPATYPRWRAAPEALRSCRPDPRARRLALAAPAARPPATRAPPGRRVPPMTLSPTRSTGQRHETWPGPVRRPDRTPQRDRRRRWPGGSSTPRSPGSPSPSRSSTAPAAGRCSAAAVP